MRAARTLALALVIALLSVATAHAAVPTGELLQNPGAEAAAGSPDGNTNPPVPDWTATGTFTAIEYGAPTFPTLDDGSRVGGGKNFFAGGPTAGLSTGTQTISLASSASDIDTGTVPVTLSGFLGGYSTQDDNMKVDAIFSDAAGSERGRLTIGPVTPAERGGVTTLLFRSASGTVPAGTRTITVVITATRLEGESNDGYGDNLSLRLEPAPPAPVLSKSVTITPVSGAVLVQVPGSKKFVSISDVRTLPVGTIVDTRGGRVRLEASDGHGGTQFADFYQGEFKYLQPKGGKGLVELDLVGSSFKSCPRGLRAAAGKSKAIRQLWGQGSGKFRTKGRFASATIRGTTWVTTDRCDGTQVRVTTGTVTVRDLVKGRNIPVTAPGTYFAKARKR